MIDYVYKNISQVDKFLLIAPGDILKILLDYPIYLFPQVIYVYAYYDNANNLERDKNFYQKEYPKIKFVHERNAETQIFEKLMVNHAISSLRLIERETLNSVVSSMEQRISTKRSNAASCHSKKPKILSVATDCICPYCKLIFREPYQLNCGHRCCESCINFTDNKMICLTCSEVSTNENIRSDRGFSIDMQQQSISCSICTWVGSLVLYQYDHSNLGQTVNKSGIQQEILLNIFSPSCTIFLPHYSSTINDQHCNNINFDIIAQELKSIQQTLDSALSTSYCGAYIWKINNIRQKIVDAQTGRQKSIYSSVFYSSQSGYKMCLRLYLNGDGDVRDTHMSLFLVIMRGKYDAILYWPFSYQVSFCLMDQSPLNNNRRHITALFEPDIRSDCFQQPVYSMNHGYGIKDFMSLMEFEQNKSLYVIDDIMFIEAKINFFSERPAMSSISHTVGSPNDEEYVDTIGEDFTNIN
ncbi:unnamed protein product [Rotaria sp. Silwood2]|nr:unnamed protein product [Rotaria sp. Silwood2]